MTSLPRRREELRFPPGFLFGAAAAAFQIEGAAREDGRTPSIWDTFCRVPGKVHHGDDGDIACDHYHRLEQDLDLIAELGLDSYRFSIAWPRVMPHGASAVNQKGLDFYRRLTDGLRARGVKPMATVYHWDLPQTLEDVGGWRKRDTAFRLAELAAAVGEALRDSVDFWVTVNEPWCASFVGYLEGRHAPGDETLQGAIEASHHLLLAHGLVTYALRAAGVAGEIGIALNLSDVHAATDRPEDLAAAARIDGNENRWFLDPLHGRGYPVDMLAWYAERADLSGLDSEDLDTISVPLDFLGINYYEQHQVVANRDDPIHGARKLTPEPPVTDYGVAVRPQGFAAVIRRVGCDYSALPLYVTENGATYIDYQGPDGEVRDPERVEYMRLHLSAAKQLIDEGIDLRGYYAWSLMDNFEWAQGYSRRFGLVFVDFGTQRRILKSSAKWYQTLIATQSGWSDRTVALGS
jgi:beta-glucosidase